MKLVIMAMGKTRFAFLREGIAHYQERISRMGDVEWVEIPDVKFANRLPSHELQTAEEEIFRKHLKPYDNIYLLDEKGQTYSSAAFAKFLEGQMLHSKKHLVLVIGGAYGFGPGLSEMATGKLALSSLTFSHQLVRLILAEQIFRGLSIIRGLPYHNE